MSSLERRYLDPWDIENYIYLRKGPARRRSVCFDKAVQYASYHEDGLGPIYGSLVEAGLKSPSEYPDDKSLYTYNSLPPPSHCPSCHRDLDDYANLDDDLYEDLKGEIIRPHTQRFERVTRKELLPPEKRRETRRKRLQQLESSKFGMNTFGHLRIDYSGNWNKLDRYIGHV